jgi:hypothetical protein
LSNLEKLQRLKDDFPFYARNCLTIRAKDAEKKPFVINKAQQHIHALIEQQLKETGKVRAVILKGRQQGASTYIQGRFTWRVTHKKGVRAFILTHEDDATQNLFSMGKRYYENLPAFVQPSLSSSNARELMFNKLDSGYKVGTAGNKSVGRSQTNQFFHGSEVAFWPNAAEHAKGILQTIPDMAGTEIIYESTANGLGNFFHQQWKMAETGLSDFIAIFVPWFWQDEYRKELPIDFDMSTEEEELAEQYQLDDSQIYFRRQKVIELSADGTNGEKAFKQEYPMNASEAFQVSGGDGLITSHEIVRARKNKVTPSGPYVVGVDPSRGGDRFSVVKRMGRKVWSVESKTGAQVDKLGKAVAWCKQVLDTVDPVAEKKPDMMFIDAGGGSDLVDRLQELGYSNVKAIFFGATPLNPLKYINRRGEMWGECNLWLKDENLAVELPDSDTLQADLCASPYDRDSKDRIVLWKKSKIKKEYGFSPDEGDAVALTFAEPVRENMKLSKPRQRGWMSV